VRLSLLLVLVALGFAAPAAARPPMGIVRGTVTRGPLTPICSDAQPCYGPAVGVRLVFLRDGRPVAHTTARDDGAYRIRLTAGRYGIRVRGWRRWTPTHVRVRRGRVTHLDVAIDTGIR
jgi:hypothetical protein